MPAEHTRLANEEAAAWGRWVSTAQMGGTPEQRAWAWDQYTAALAKLVKATVLVRRKVAA